MNRVIFLLILVFGIFTAALGQRASITLTFSAVDSATWVQLDSIKVMNRTQGSDTVLYYPDTVLVLDFTVAISEPVMNNETFRILTCYPNPAANQTTITLFVPQKDNVNLIVTDLMGKVLLRSDRMLDQGLHSFLFKPGNGNLLFFSARWRGSNSSVKIIQAGSPSNKTCSLEYLGGETSIAPLKTFKEIQGFSFNLGDKLLYIGYHGSTESGMLDSPVNSKSYTFQFATNIPCPGTPFITYDGEIYNTIQVFGQCWLKENLRVGTIVPVNQFMTDNNKVEKYCYFGAGDTCNKYGGLYQWHEMMQYSFVEGARGICPPGWHIPSDEEWKVLEGSVDGQFGIGDPQWDLTEQYRGNDAGKNLKTSNSWEFGNTGNDAFGFSALPGGARYYLEGSFYGFRETGKWWTSTKPNSNIYTRELYYLYDNIDRDEEMHESFGFSVRCLKSEENIESIVLHFNAVYDTISIQLDNIKIINRTQGKEIELMLNDTTIVLPDDLLYLEGDELLMIGYSGTLASGIIDIPSVSKTYTFQFATNIPCPGAPTVTYEGQVYNTIQIFSQCWLKENLNVGTMIPGDEDMSDNSFLEKYCYNNEPDSCAKFGGLYQWDEIMLYSTQQRTQGICPNGWHIPTDEEWKVLEGAADSMFGIGDPEWDSYDIRGFDVGKNLKATWSWGANGSGNDILGFSVLSCGSRHHFYHVFHTIGFDSYFWTSSSNSVDNDWIWVRRFWNYSTDLRMDDLSGNGFSVRCLKDD